MVVTLCNVLLWVYSTFAIGLVYMTDCSGGETVPECGGKGAGGWTGGGGGALGLWPLLLVSGGTWSCKGLLRGWQLGPHGFLGSPENTPREGPHWDEVCQDALGTASVKGRTPSVGVYFLEWPQKVTSPLGVLNQCCGVSCPCQVLWRWTPRNLKLVTLSTVSSFMRTGAGVICLFIFR